MVAAKDWPYRTQPEVMVERRGVSPVNPSVKWAQTTCGHEHFYSAERGPRHRRCPRVGATIVCDQCAAKADGR